jgi:peptide chain release factor 1
VFDKLQSLKEQYLKLCEDLTRPEIISNQKNFKDLARQQNELKPVADAYDIWVKLEHDLQAANELALSGDDEMASMAKEELVQLTEQKNQIEKQLRKLLLPKDPNDGKSVFVEVRAGTGGDEAALFAGVLARMYSRFAENHGWKVELASSSPTGLGGYKEIILFIQGREAHHHLKHESGVHRVQRVPQTEAQGRIHTSTVTVVVMPEVDDVEIQVKDEDLRVDVFRSSGPGGQSVNTTDSAVRITHIPSGLVVSCQDEKSQIKNRAKALKILKARLVDQERLKKEASMSQMRKSQIGTGDRSERIRTYNYPQSRITDHRINYTTHRLPAILDGAVDELSQALNDFEDAEAMKS